MKKINILKSNEDFGRIIHSNDAIKSKNFIIYIEKNNNDVHKFGISVSKKIGNAVCRNKIKRQIKDIIDKKDYKNNFNCIIIVRKNYLNFSYEENKNNLYHILEKYELEKGE